MSLFRTLLSQLSRLPSEYQELEWIKGTGTQYINLNLSGLNGILCEYDVVHDSDYKSLDSNGGYIIGSHGLNYPYGRNGGWYKAGTANAWELGYGEIYPGVSRTLVFGQKYHVKFCTFYDEAYIEVDGQRLTTQSGQTVTDNLVYVFQNGYGINYGDPSTIAKLYGAKISKKVNDEIVLMRDLVPCYRKTDNEIGLYDLVDKIFYTNNGTGRFICYPEPNYTLPSTYQQVEYIQSTGTQYINLLTKGDQNTKIELTITPYEPNTEATLIGARDNYTRNAMSLTLYSYGWYCYGQTEGRLNLSFQSDTKYNIIIDNNKVQYKFPTDENYTNAISLSKYTFTTKNLYVFADDFNGQTRYYSKCKLFDLKIYKSGSLIKKFVPCYRKSDNEIGLYEVMEQKFYTNAGTGTFIKGNDV